MLTARAVVEGSGVVWVELVWVHLFFALPWQRVFWFVAASLAGVSLPCWRAIYTAFCMCIISICDGG